MLHLYKRSTYLIVNGEPHTKLQYNVTVLRDDTEPDRKFLIKDATWQEMFKRAQNDDRKWMYADQTFWKQSIFAETLCFYLALCFFINCDIFSSSNLNCWSP